MTTAVTTTEKRKRGRPPSGVTTMSRQLVRDLIDSEESPLHVMIDNMLFWYRKVPMLTKKVEQLLDEALGNKNLKPEDVEKIRYVFDTMLQHREKSQGTANDLSPYAHPRLQAVQVSIEKKELPTIEKGDTEQSAAQKYAILAASGLED